MNKKSEKNIDSGIYPKEKITFMDIINSIKINPKIDEVGSILAFTGLVRKSSEDNKPVKGLIIDAYKELADKNIKKICEDILKEEGIIDIKIIHLIGEFSISEELVYVIIASAHRKEGFKGLQTAIERYKKELSIWKKELYLDRESKWIH
ncbi:MAG: molybdenum cofactor biosynthesis protein MoaE [Candidatus Lokiarchaeota archaeon]|nr:molybdenum cofactor biosynthesis protein MoaE [Candidatus Lokiarchaeota archaeon]